MSALLGQNPSKKLHLIIEKVLAEIGVRSYADRETGEIDQNNRSKFLELEDRLRLELYRKANVYRAQATRIRAENKMRPFSWTLETRERIEHYIQTEKWQLPRLRVVEELRKKNPKEEADTLRHKPTRKDHAKRTRQIH